MTPPKNDNPGCLSAILRLFALEPKEKPDEKLPYIARESVLSAAEISFFHVLHSILASKYQICLKMRLADILEIVKTENYMSYFNKLSQRHIDFLICHPETMKPVLAVELDDSSHSRKNRQERDEFVNQAFKAAGLPLLRIPAGRSYNTKELEAAFQEYLTNFAQKNDQQSPDHDIPSCPKCNSVMVLRTVKKGEHKGEQFYICSNYPDCRGAVRVK